MRPHDSLAQESHSESGTTEQNTILVVDDSAVDRRVVGRTLEQDPSLRAIYAEDGAKALESVARERPAAVITDLQMPEMDGLQLVRAIREKYPSVPVILMTGQGSEEIAIEALRAGAASYVPKRNIVGVLMSAIEQVLTASRTDERRTRILRALSGRASRYVLENDPSLVTPLVELLREELIAFGLCDATGATRSGIALEEAILNAVYHGNLGVSSDLKLSGDGLFERTAAARRLEEPYRSRRVGVSAELSPSLATFVIEDEGQGFNATL